MKAKILKKNTPYNPISEFFNFFFKKILLKKSPKLIKITELKIDEINKLNIKKQNLINIYINKYRLLIIN